MGCGCGKKKSNPTTPGKDSGELSKYAYLTPRQLRLKKEQEQKDLANKEDK